jgi:DNA-binding MarR family transcriptional regulator
MVSPMANAFSDREPAKKRVITVSVTAEQDRAFEALKKRTRTVTDGAMIKQALAWYIDHVSPEDGEPNG